MFMRARRNTLARARGIKPYVSPGARLRRKIAILTFPVAAALAVMIVLGEPRHCEGRPCEEGAQLVGASIYMPLATPGPQSVNQALVAAQAARGAQQSRARATSLFLTDALASR